MITRELKLKLNNTQEAKLNQWLWNLTGVYNWAIRKIELDANNKIYHSKFDFQNLLANHSNKLGIPSHTIQGVLCQAYDSWQRCFKKLSKKPKLKGRRNKLNSIPFTDKPTLLENNRLKLCGFPKGLRFHKQDIPEGALKTARIVKKASGWYVAITIDTKSAPITPTGFDQVGIDPGFKHLLTLSNGEKVANPLELKTKAKRLAQAQRGKNKKLTARIHERIANTRKDRNHKLSNNLVAQFELIAFSKDNLRGMSRKFGKSVASAGHGQLRQFLSYKSSSCGRQFVEVGSKNSTRTCCACGALSGPSGWAGLKVRVWRCSVCGTEHDRDVNAAINTLRLGVGATPEIPKFEGVIL